MLIGMSHSQRRKLLYEDWVCFILIVQPIQNVSGKNFRVLNGKKLAGEAIGRIFMDADCLMTFSVDTNSPGNHRLRLTLTYVTECPDALTILIRSMGMTCLFTTISHPEYDYYSRCLPRRAVPSRRIY